MVGEARFMTLHTGKGESAGFLRTRNLEQDRLSLLPIQSAK